mgnify:CR=1 FL=1
MKKILYILLLPLILFLVSCGGGSDDFQPVTNSLEETLIEKKWCLSNQDENGFKLSENGEFMITEKCAPHIILGSWIIEDSLIKYFYIDNSIQTTFLWGEITEYSANQVKILINNTSTSTTEAIYSLTPEDIYGCTNDNYQEYNPLAECDDASCFIYDSTYCATCYIALENSDGTETMWYMSNSSGGEDFCGNELITVEDPVYMHTVTETLTSSDGVVLLPGEYGISNGYEIHCE